MSVKVDTSEDPIEMKCAFVSVCKEIVLDDSGESQRYAISSDVCTYSVILNNMLQCFKLVCGASTRQLC